MGILDMFGLGGPAQGGGLGIGEQLQAGFAPDVYAAKHQRAMEQALQAAMAQRPGVTPEMAHAFGMNPQAIESAQPKFQQTGMDLYGNPQYGFPNPYNQTVTPANQGPPGTTTSPGQAVSPQGSTSNNPAALIENVRQQRESGKNVDDIVENLPSPYKGPTKALLAGQTDLRSLIGNRDTPYRRALADLITTLGYDEGQLKTRMEFTKDLGNTKSGMGKSLAAAPKLINHYEGAVDKFDKLFSGGGQWNSPGNALTAGLEQATGYVEKANQNRNLQKDRAGLLSGLEDNAETYALERGNFLTPQSGGTQLEHLQTKKNFDANNSPQHTIGLLQAEWDVLNGQFNGFEQRRDTAIGPNSNNPRFEVYPSAQKAQMARIKTKLDAMAAKYGTDLGGNVSPAAAAPGATAATPPPSAKEQAGVKFTSAEIAAEMKRRGLK